MDIQKEEKFEALPEIEMMLRENPDIKFENGGYVYHGLNQLTALAVCYVAGAWMAWKAAKANAVPEWFVAKEIKPVENDSDEKVLTWDKVSGMRLVSVWSFKAVTDVTHWMPLPDAPQEPANADTNS